MLCISFQTKFIQVIYYFLYQRLKKSIMFYYNEQRRNSNASLIYRVLYLKLPIQLFICVINVSARDMDKTNCI